MAHTSKITSEIVREIINGTNDEYVVISTGFSRDNKVLVVFSKVDHNEYEITYCGRYVPEIINVVATGETWTVDEYIQAKRTADAARRLYLKSLGN